MRSARHEHSAWPSTGDCVHLRDLSERGRNVDKWECLTQMDT